MCRCLTPLQKGLQHTREKKFIKPEIWNFSPAVRPYHRPMSLPSCMAEERFLVESLWAQKSLSVWCKCKVLKEKPLTGLTLIWVIDIFCEWLKVLIKPIGFASGRPQRQSSAFNLQLNEVIMSVLLTLIKWCSPTLEIYPAQLPSLTFPFRHYRGSSRFLAFYSNYWKARELWEQSPTANYQKRYYHKCLFFFKH